MANRTLEIFSGDVLQFGQGNTFNNEINVLDFKSGNVLKKNKNVIFSLNQMFMRALGVILTTTTTSEETNKMSINV